MLKNYFTTTIRNLAKNKTHALINIAGLALGIVCALIIFLIIKFDLGFDAYHDEVNRIYRVVSTIDEFGEIDHGAGVPYPLPIALRNDFPEIERITVIDNNFTPAVFAVTRDDGTAAKFKQDEGVAFVNPDYFKIFRYEWVLGDPDRALAQPQSVVISRVLAEKFFGQENPLGKRIVYDNRHEAQVTGVVKDVPPNTDLPFNMLFAYDHKERGNDDWSSTSSAVQCYLRLPTHLDPQQIESRLGEFVAKYRKKNDTKKIALCLQPLRRLHFDTRFNVFSGRAVSKMTLAALGLIGVFFNEAAPSEILGNVLTFRSGDAGQDFIIAGIMSNVPRTSSFQFDVLIPIEHYGRYGVDNNWAGAATVYVQLAKGTDATSLEAAFPPFVEKQFGAKVKDFPELGIAGDIKEAVKLRLQPLTEVHLDKNTENHYLVTSNITYSIVLATIALLILFIACINFMTLSIGRSAGRSLEVGVRKVLGATQTQVIRQFWGEAILLSIIAMVLGLGLAELFLPVFNTLAQKQLSLSLFDNWQTLLILLGIMLLTGLFAGSYPAVVLSRFQPATMFKAKGGVGGRNRFTQILVVLQYVLAIVLLIATGVISQQLTYLRTKDLGYNQEQVVIVSVPGETFSERFKTRLAQYDKVISAGGSDRSFTSGWQTRDIRNDQGGWQEIRLIRIDSDYLKTLSIELIAGRNFSASHPSDTMQAVIVNETFVNTLGWTDPLGKRLEDLKTRDDREPPTIIGVAKDFHIDGLQKKIEPLVLHMNPDRHGIYNVFVRLRPENMSATIELLKQTWESVAPNVPFRLSFLDENLENQYRNEQRWQKIVTYASIFAIVISCLGLLGLASLAVTRRTKEIGIRKVLGASAAGIVGVLTKDFVKLMLIANFIAWLVAYFAMNSWLQNFAYRIEMVWWMFVLAGGLALLIALLTVSTQALRAALANPVEALRYE